MTAVKKVPYPKVRLSYVCLLFFFVVARNVYSAGSADIFLN
jgi:hypothetical protein